MFRAEKEEAQLNNLQQPAPPRQHLDPKKAAPQRTTIIRNQQHPPSFFQQHNYNNPHKKSLVVNGNGHSPVITSISREKLEHRNRLQL